MGESKVGVVIPCYNQSQYLGEALESVAWQTHRPFSVVAVDDASEEGWPIVRACLPHRPFILSHDENRGPSAARNSGIQFLIDRGCDTILPLDADDLLEPEMIEAGLEVLEQGFDMAYPDYEYFGKYRGRVRNPPRTSSQLARVILRKNEMVNTTLYRAEVWQAIKEHNGTGYDPMLHKREHYGWEDWLFWIEAHLLGFKARGIQRTLLRYRTHEESGVDKANENAPNVWAYFQRRVKKLYGVKLEDQRWQTSRGH